MNPAIISAAASVVGGLLGRSKAPKTVSAFKNSKDAISGQAYGARVAGEKYGFNPLTLLGVSSAVGPSTTASNNYMGQAIADAGLMLAEGLAKREEKLGRIAALEKQNEELREKVRDVLLRPKVGGVYAQRQAQPTLQQAVGRKTNGTRQVARAAFAGDGGVSTDDPPSAGVIGGARPPQHPLSRPVDMIPVRDIGGNRTSLPAPVAKRIGVEPFGQLVVEDMETLYGDEGGQVVALPSLGDAMAYHNTGKPPAPMFGEAAVAGKKKVRDLAKEDIARQNAEREAKREKREAERWNAVRDPIMRKPGEPMAEFQKRLKARMKRK